MRSIPPPGQSGWYLLEGALHRIPDAAFPFLHLSKGATSLRVPLAMPGTSGLSSSVVLIPEGVESLEVENGADGACAIDGVRLRRIARAEALIRMVDGIGRYNGWPTAARACISALTTLLRFGRSASARLIMSCYLRSLHPNPSPMALAHVHDGLFRSVELPLNPSSQLQALCIDGVVQWLSTDGDPQFHLDLASDGMPLSPGWYRLRVDAREHHGHLVAPCLYADYGGGFTTDTSIRLPEYDGSRIDALVLLKRETRAIRFDPTIRSCSFSMTGFSVHRLNRIAAFAHMLRGVATASGRWSLHSLASASWGFVATAARDGISLAAADLFAKQAGMQGSLASSYPQWLRKYDRVDKAVLDRQVMAVGQGPLFSLIMPVYETPEPWLRKCIDSVLQQAYQNWELCIADDRSPSEHVRRVLEEYSRLDSRIKVTYRDVNGHISEASNSALALASGEFIGLLDHDDELRPQALLRVAEALKARPGLDFLYSDEDKIDETGRRFQPNFKPDWNPDLLLSQNYVCHFTVIRTSLVRSVEGFRTGFEGSQDHDLILRCTERLTPKKIHHIPEILYHWRAIAGSTALERGAKDYAAEAGLRAVSDYLRRTKANATVEALPHGHYHVRWSVPDPAPKVSIIVPTRDRLELLQTCVESVLTRTQYPNFEVVVVDNQSAETPTLEYLDKLRHRPGVRVLKHDAPFNYAAINNRAVRHCDARLICLLNNDIEVISNDWLSEMVGQAIRPEIGAVGAMLYYPDDTIQHAGVILGLGGVANHAYVGQPKGYPGHGARALVAQNLSSVTGACLVVRRDVYMQVGGLDEELEVAFNDVDFCLRVREAGYRNLWTPFAELYHHESASRGRDEEPEKRERFVREVLHMEKRWGESLLRDPAYNPNLTLDDVNFGLAFPPRKH